MTDNTIILYTTADGQARFLLRELGEQLWLTQAEMAELYQTSKQNISKHIAAVLAEGELSEAATVNFQLTVQNEGGRQVSREIAHYSLPMIIAVGYRVRSTRGTQFRQWATRTLGEYLHKGFVLDDVRLKNPPVGTLPAPDYFDELLERIRDIRASEKRIYLRVREIFALAADYQPSFKETTQFFKVIQNKLHFAATGQTAAELIYRRADAAKPQMGLTHTDSGSLNKKDITVAKNYLQENEIRELNRIVTMWLDFAEDQAQRKKLVFLRDWADKLDQFLQFNDRDVLQGAGRVSKKQADAKAAAEYERYQAAQRRLKEQQGEADIAELLHLKKPR
ncbi:virulence RhuM family protein [Neisseria animalis]|uniref:Hydroxyacid dehydrogenase n=1 Tax=Neisseria animalis TaxID=492 RepID=A0A5P3MQG9_NEIAN|nr:RhuM family protein [Neisseria animalis]QEY23847.1 hydroxyacid dehydrogenase [Neisseria animalis]ROW32085.1 hydroxyacid dehydrogenase [Neisseria animalis]VEE05694.1 DNA-binding protein [Neisseria animalis]